MAKKKSHRGGRAISVASRLPAGLINGLARAEELLDRKQLFEAREQLEALDRRYPNNIDVLSRLVNVHYDLKDNQGYEQVIARVSRLASDDGDIALSAEAGART
jgi:uncharacterized protein HemY